jgi:hypothetical protein
MATMILNCIKRLFGFGKKSLVGSYVKTSRGLVFRIERQSDHGLTVEVSKGHFRLDQGTLVWVQSTHKYDTLSRNNFKIISEEEAEILLQQNIRNKTW